MRSQATSTRSVKQGLLALYAVSIDLSAPEDQIKADLERKRHQV
jgi:hypothetical protein